MGVAMVPPSDDAHPMLFEIKVVGGALGFIALGGLVYWRASRATSSRAFVAPQLP